MNSKIVLFTILFLSLILFLRLFIHIQNVQQVPQGAKIAFEGKIINQPRINARGQRASMILPNDQRISILFNLGDQLLYGDRVKVAGIAEYFEAENGNMVAYMNYPEYKLIKKAVDENFILKIREDIIKFFNSSLDPASASLMLGITFGIKQEMPEGFYLNLQKKNLFSRVAYAK